MACYSLGKINPTNYLEAETLSISLLKKQAYASFIVWQTYDSTYNIQIGKDLRCR